MSVLPFDREAMIAKQGGAPLAAGVPISPIWPTGDPRQTQTGEAYDCYAEMPLEAASHFGRGYNREILIDGRRLKVIAAEPMELVPHLALKLLEIR